MKVRFLPGSLSIYRTDFMERETGIEPVTSSLGSWRSTAELLPLAESKQSLALDDDRNNCGRRGSARLEQPTSRSESKVQFPAVLIRQMAL
jgi:hypothetical protein